MNEQIQYFLQIILLALLPVMVASAAYWLYAKAKAALSEIGQWNPDLLEILEQAARFAVTAAEQAKLGEAIEEQYKTKKAYALAMAEKWLATKGIKNIDLDLLAAAIEKAVYEKFNKSKELTIEFESMLGGTDDE